MSGMGDLAFSMQMRDTIDRMVKEAIDRERPRYRYAKVTKIDRTARKCDVIYNGETSAVRVNMGSVQPHNVDQIVRVEGIGTDKFITDVIGFSWTGFREGTVESLYTAGPAKVQWEGDTLFSGPYVPAAGYHPRGGDKVFAVEIPNKPTVIIKAQSYTSDDNIFPRYHPLTLINGWYSYSNLVYGPGTPDQAYQHPRVTRTSTGIVKLSGLIAKGSAIVPGEVICNLPVGFRPGYQMMITSEGNLPRGSLDIGTNGDVIMRSGQQGFVSLDNIAFPSAEVAPDSAWTLPALLNGFLNYRTAPWGGGAWAPAGWWVDAEGIVWRRGLIGRAGMLTYAADLWGDTGLNPQYHQHYRTTVANTFGWLFMGGAQGSTSGSRTQVPHVNNPYSNSYLSLDGTPYIPATSAMNSRWLSMSLENGWADYDVVNYGPAQYMRTPSGMVFLRGLIRSGTTGKVATLPVGYRPKYNSLHGGVAFDLGYRQDVTGIGHVIASTGYSTSWSALNSTFFIAEQ